MEAQQASTGQLPWLYCPRASHCVCGEVARMWRQVCGAWSTQWWHNGVEAGILLKNQIWYYDDLILRSRFSRYIKTNFWSYLFYISLKKFINNCLIPSSYISRLPLPTNHPVSICKTNQVKHETLGYLHNYDILRGHAICLWSLISLHCYIHPLKPSHIWPPHQSLLIQVQ